MKRKEDQSGFQWAAQVLREGSRNEKENFSLAEAPATGGNLFSLAEAPATGRTLFSLAEAPATVRKPFSLEVQPDTDKYGCVPIPMPMSPYPGLHARSLNLPPKPDAHIPVPIRPDTHAR